MKNYIGAVLVGLAIFLLWAWALPFYNQTTASKAAVIEKQGLVNSRNAVIENIKNLTKEYQKRTGDIKKLAGVVPAQKSIAEIVSAVENITSKNGVQLINLSVVEQNSGDVSSPYKMLAINMGINGGYPAMVNTLRGLEKSIRLLDVFQIDATQITTPTGQVVLNFKIQTNAYYLP